LLDFSKSLVKPHYRFIRIHVGRSALEDFIDTIAMPDWQAQGDLRGYCHWIWKDTRYHSL
jgi:hypothetical protein